MNDIDKLKKQNKRLKIVHIIITAYIYAVIIYLAAKIIIGYIN